MLDFLHHLFFPRESNNHRARILHLQPLFFLVILLSVMSYLTPIVERRYPQILGIYADISVADLHNLTNQKRQEAGLPALNLDSQLSTAALNKANDMLTKNYWAHNAPDGTTPWVFIKSAGYDYLYAGENLARGFTTANEAVEAWMASPGHRDNILSAKYKDVGFAIVTGTLTGDETVLIVQEFGERINGFSTVSAPNTLLNPTAQPAVTAEPTYIAQLVLPTSTPFPTLTESITPMPIPTEVVAPAMSNPLPTITFDDFIIASINKSPLFEKEIVTRSIAVFIAAFFIILFIVDLVIIERKKIIRLVSHSVDHIIFLTLIIITVILFKHGFIL